ncbi:MAG: tetratricopeptide repeat protein [Mucilaginibacter sp.]
MKNIPYGLLLIAFVFSCHNNKPQPGEEFLNAGIEKASQTADSAQTRRNYELALRDFNKAIEINPTYEDAYEQRAIVRRTLHDRDGALLDAEKAVSLDPSRAKYLYGFIGETLDIKKDYIGAVKAYTKAIAADPEFASAYQDRAQVEEELKDDVDALRDYNKTIELVSSSSKALKNIYSMRGYLKIRLNDKNGACADFHKALELGDTSAQRVINENCK